MHEALLRVVGVEVDDAEDDVVALALGVGDQGVVGGVEELHVLQALQRGMLAAYAVQALDEPQQRPVEPPALELVLLVVDVLLAAWPLLVLEVLEAAVDAVGRAQRRREDQPDGERRRPAVRQVVGEDVRRVGEEVGPEVLRLLGVSQLAHVLDELPARVLPGEVGVGLAEADLRQLAHDRPPRERLGQEDDLGMVAADLRDEPAPERDRLRVRVVDAEDGHAPLDPAAQDVVQRLPEPAPVLAVPVDVVDVLVLLGRVLRVLERPVGAPVEPLGMLGEPRVVGRALDREVQGDLDAVLLGRAHQRREVLERPEVGMDRVVAAVLVADRPRAAGVVGAGDERVVATLAVRVADGMDRRQVEDVEAQLA
jgi:hypothetical protein